MPVQFRSETGNAPDVRTHLETWESLRRVSGRTDFLSVADCKLCDGETMDTIAGRGGHFVTVLPRSRFEDGHSRKWIQTHEPAWEAVWDRPNPRQRRGPRDRWWVFPFPLPSREGWPVIWVRSALLALRQDASRQERIARAVQELDALDTRFSGGRARRRTRAEIWKRVEKIREDLKVARYLRVQVTQEEVHRFRQSRPGRPGPATLYRRHTRRRWRLHWKLDEDALAYDRKSDGMYPLLTNDRKLSPRQVLEAHKCQPNIEKRFEQAKTVHQIAPVLLKNEGRVEALFFLYFLALLVQALLERELRRAMKAAGIRELPLYPEERRSRQPAAQQVLRLFSLAERHVLLHEHRVIQVFEPELTELQRRVLDLLAVPVAAYRAENRAS